MKDDMKKIDELIEQALSEEERTYFHQLDEQGVFEGFFSLFQGKLGWITKITTILNFIFAGLTIWALVKFFQTDDLMSALKWGVGGILLFLGTQMLKFWHWMQMDKNAIIREMKRMEYQISLLAKKQS